ncbi:MAG: polysaccharide deacetylase family protein [Rhodocyclaceae bacterium]
MPRRWIPSPFMTGSAVLHSAAAVAVAVQPAAWPWALGAVAANHALLTAAGLWPTSALLGPNLRRLPPASAERGKVALTLDDGPDPEVTPRVLDLLDSAGAKASFFCIGARAAAHPELAREIVARGHEVENHSQNHAKLFAAHGWRRMEREVAEGQATLAGITGRVPRFFRPTAGLRSPLLEPILCRHDLALATWTRRAFDTRCTDAALIHRRITARVVAGDILLLHDGNSPRGSAGKPVILEALPLILDTLRSHGLRCVTLESALP